MPVRDSRAGGLGLAIGRYRRRHGDLAALGRHRSRRLPAQLPVIDARRQCAGVAARRGAGLAADHVSPTLGAAVAVAVAAALGHAGVYHRLHLHRPAGCGRARAIAVALRAGAGLRRVLVSRDPLPWRGRGDAVAGVVSVCLRAGAGGLYRAVRVRVGGRPNLGLQSDAGVPQGGVALGEAGDLCRAVAGVDGNAGRLRHHAVFRRRHLHHRHLPRLVRARQQRRRGATLGDVDRLRVPVALAGAPLAAAGAVSPHQRAVQRAA